MNKSHWVFRHILMALAIALCSPPLVAHDLWIEPSSFAPNLGEVVGVRLRVGEHLQGDALPLMPALVNQFVVQDAANRRPVFARRGAEPAGAIRIVNPGLHIVGYHSHASSVELAADKFNTYLIEEGLDGIAALQAERQQTGSKVRERFSRCAKSLVLSGAPSEAQGDRPLGFPLELVAERNPFMLAAAEALPVRLTYQDQPLQGALVVAMNSRDPSAKQAQRTDRDGRVRFSVRRGGLWLVKAVHMVAALPGEDADWASYWASLTFGLGAPSNAAE